MTSNGTWLELSVECDNEAVESVSELFARYGFNNGVVIEEPFTQDPDGDNLKVDLSRPVTVRTFLAKIDAKEEDIELIRGALWHLGQMRHVGALGVTEREEEVLGLPTQRLRDREIAERLFVTPSTVNYHLKDSYAKLEVRSRREAIATLKRLNAGPRVSQRG